MQHCDNRLTMDSLNATMTIWSTTTSPTLFIAFKNLFKLLMHDTGNEKEKFPENPVVPNLLETSQNPSPMHPSQTTSLARFLCRSRITTPALHRETLPH